MVVVVIFLPHIVWRMHRTQHPRWLHAVESGHECNHVLAIYEQCQLLW